MNRVPRGRGAKNWGKRWIRKAVLNQLFYPDVKDVSTLLQSVLAPLMPTPIAAPLATLTNETLQMEDITDEDIYEVFRNYIADNN